MAQKVNIIVLCDAHIAAGDESVEGTEYSVAVEGGKAAPIALCDEHRDQLFSPLADLYYSISGSRRPRGTATKAAASSNGGAVKEQTLTCEHCGKTFSTNDGLKRPAMALSLHVKNEHPEDVAEPTDATNDEPAAEEAKPAKKAAAKKSTAKRGSKKAEPVPA